MSYEKCPFANSECRYWDRKPKVAGETNGCFADKQHIYGQAEAKALGKMAVEFCNLPRNVINPLCRAQHEEMDQGYHWRPPYPPSEVMKMVIEADKGRGNGTAV